MSYPDLGCFAECLECELCDGGNLDLDLDLDLDDWDGDGWDDFDNWGPDEEDGNFFDNLDLPDVYPVVKPQDGGWFFGVGGKF